MNRQTILAVIHRQLRESLAETGEVRPLGEIVGSVSEEIRGSRNGQAAPAVIPIETVAAFVDGNLSSEEADAVCRAVMVDNSVLAELVSAVRALGQPTETLDPLPDVLRNQLMAMQASLPSPAIEPEGTEPLPVADTSPQPTIRTEPVIRRAAANKSGRHWKPLMAVLSVAAALAAVIFVASRDRDQPSPQPEIVQNDPQPNQPLPNLPDAPEEQDLRVVESSEPPTPPDAESPLIDRPPDRDPAPNRTPAPAIVQQVPPDKRPSTVPRRPEMVPDPSPQKLVQVTPLTGLRWTKVTGVLTRKNEVATTSASQTELWESVDPSASGPLEDLGRQVVLRTLPLSRAEASLQSGGQIVLPSDSGMELSRGDSNASAEVKLQYGDAALVDLPKGTVIRLIKAGHELATLRWRSQASAVLQHSAGGLDVHVDGEIDINAQQQHDASVTIARDRSIKSIPQPKRKPAWVDRPVETINVKQTFLAQINQSANLMGTLNQQIRTLSQNPRMTDAEARTLTTLAQWQAALAGENVFRLAASPMPVLRMAALDRVASLPSWDPRYQRIWTAVENRARDKRRAARFKRLIFLAQQNVAPNPAQIKAMLDDLSAPDVASRAMSDFLLRRFHSKAAQRLPKFDPTWTGQSQLRGVNLWRAYLQRNINAAQRRQPAAAIDRLQN